ncbi:MAG: tRNA 5-methoxyuridine(34)/uridine 5-oxyacetic acid(34) synthase CmoB [Candidatus Rifleibacteriota bacterium]
MNIEDFEPLFLQLSRLGLEKWDGELKKLVEVSLAKPDGNLSSWQQAVSRLPEITGAQADLRSAAVTLYRDQKIDEAVLKNLKECLFELMPWRKGPFSLFNIYIDTEWRSDFKWNRLENHITSLKGRRVLDIGCGNGYHLFRMHGAGAEIAIGADPSFLFLAQFSVIKKYLPDLNVFLLPLGVEELPESQAFDTVFSMGVLYHRRSPFDFLRQLKMQLRPGGELVLETLVIEGDQNCVLVPADRYARMKNVWFIPSPAAMLHWLQRAGFKNARMIDLTATSVDEQRSTDWMRLESLSECLDKNNSRLTVEGYPAPLRAVFMAER